MKLKVLASGSKGNSYILSSPTGTLLIECGISYQNIMQGLNYDLRQALGVLLTHSHNDHSKAVTDLIKAGVDVYTSQPTVDELGLTGHRVHAVEPLKQFIIGEFQILPFETEHDAPLPLGFLIQYKPTGERILFITDSYYCKYKFNSINYLLIECNYIKETLDQNIADGYIDERMKPRLLQSHFSLENVKEFLKANDLSSCREIVLLHLSDRNSDADRMIKEIEGVTGITPKVANKGLEVELNMYPY